MKVIFPAVWITGFGAGALGVLDSALRRGADPSSEALEFLAAWIVGSAVLLLFCAPLKGVVVDERSVRISGLLREIVVPLDTIDDVTENRWINIRPVTIHFRERTEFGSRITFMPRTRFLMPWSSHPDVELLKTLVERSRVASR